MSRSDSRIQILLQFDWMARFSLLQPDAAKTRKKAALQVTMLGVEETWEALSSLVSRLPTPPGNEAKLYKDSTNMDICLVEVLLGACEPISTTCSYSRVFLQDIMWKWVVHKVTYQPSRLNLMLMYQYALCKHHTKPIRVHWYKSVSLHCGRGIITAKYHVCM